MFKVELVNGDKFDRKIELIKAVREAFGVALIDAKRFVEGTGELFMVCNGYTLEHLDREISTYSLPRDLFVVSMYDPKVDRARVQREQGVISVALENHKTEIVKLEARQHRLNYMLDTLP